VRPSGLVDTPAGVVPADHACWIAQDDAAFEEAAIRFLDEGLAAGQRLLWVGDGVAERLRRSSGPLAGVDDLLAGGTLRVLSVTEAYAASGRFSPEEQLAFYDGETRRAVDDGFRGLRAVAEVTALAADPAREAEFLRWEHLADDYVAAHPALTVLCAYRSDQLPDEVLSDAAALHPVAHAPASPPPFRLWSEDGRVVVSGDVDTFGAGRLRRLLGSTDLGRPAVVLDLSRVVFIDLAGVRSVASWAVALAERGIRPEVTGASRLFRRMWDLLGTLAPAEVSLSENRT
jgi:anti-anti-sigma regulatory factor